jgi:4-oxalocrotonate tautomerase
MPTIHVELFEGRTVAQKAAAAKAITEACVQTLGAKPESVDVIFRDVARHDWASGGKLWSEAAAAPPAAGS